MDVILRDFEKKDYLNLATLSDDQWKATHFGVAESMMKASGNIEHCILAMDGARIVGYIYGFALPNKTLIPEFLYVLPVCRKNGIGKMLVEKMESSTDCTVSMIFYNKNLRDYYSKMGYQVGDALEVAMKEIPKREGKQDEI